MPSCFSRRRRSLLSDIKRRVIETGIGVREEIQIAKNGKTFYWDLTVEPLRDSDGSVRGITGAATVQEVSETALSQKRLAFLSEASAPAASSLEYETTLANVARPATLTLADCCTVEILEDSQWVRRVAAAHLDPVKERLAQQLPQRYCLDRQAKIGLAQVLRTGKPEIYPKVTDSLLELAVADSQQLEILRRLGLKSALCVPLRARGRTQGAICFALASDRRRYGPEDLALAEELARRAAMAVDNARLYRSAVEANRMKEEFLAILSHELRTPLSAMFGWVRLLRGSHLDEATSARALEAIERNARTLSAAD